jgi:hypothetical protein
VLIYVLNVVDANVFAHLRNFDVSDNLAVDIRPTLMYDGALASQLQFPAVGMKLNITF